ncbi:MAG: SPOR domain-containing protein [Betaproteobacteria bacterium]
MADRTSDNADLAVDELRRKGRRRLVGAIVLALAAAVVVPLLLEQDPRPLGDDVSVQIPPVDEGRFISRLTGKSAPAKALPKPEARSESKAPAAEPEPKRDASQAAPTVASATAPAPESATPTAPSFAPVVPPPKKPIAEAEQRVLAPTMKPMPVPDVKPQAVAKPEVVAAKPAPAVATPAPLAAAPVETKAKAEPATAPAAANGFVVQLAAFADDKGANALANKLKKAGYAAYVEPVQTSRGTLWRVRVGGYAARVDADAARAKLKGEGYSGIVAAAK